MEEILNFLKTDIFLIVLIGVNVLLIILYLVNNMRLYRLRKSYNSFMKKIGKDEKIDETLNRYMERVQEVAKKNEEIYKYCENLDKEIDKCIKKVGIVRYSAFKDTGSDLSFALALLNEKNDGVVLNGIYSREMSNIYAKPIEKGTSTYTISEEEKKAIEKAVQD